MPRFVPLFIVRSSQSIGIKYLYLHEDCNGVKIHVRMQGTWGPYLRVGTIRRTYIGFYNILRLHVEKYIGMLNYQHSLSKYTTQTAVASYHGSRQAHHTHVYYLIITSYCMLYSWQFVILLL